MVNESIESTLALRRYVDVLYDTQDVRIRTANRLRTFPEETYKLYVNRLKEMEADLQNQVLASLVDFPIWVSWLSNVKGIGPRLGGSLIATLMIRFERVPAATMKALNLVFKDESVRVAVAVIDDESIIFTREQWSLALRTEKGDYLLPFIRGMESFPTVSSLWKFMGLHVVDGHSARRVKGQVLSYNPKNKTLAWKIGQQFIKGGDYYQMIYRRRRLMELARRTVYETVVDDEGRETIKILDCVCPEEKACRARIKAKRLPCLGHCTAMASRYAVKMFLSHLWETWRSMEGLPVRPPYALEHLTHTTAVPAPTYIGDVIHVDGKPWVKPEAPRETEEEDQPET